MNVTPVFLLSLPRAGSTLLQRLLSTHSEISTKSEPWIALPIFYALRKDGVNSEYGHNTLSINANRFVESLPEGMSDYFQCASEFLQELYMRSCNNESKYFIDKTPRYHLIVNELLAAFPEAKFIFLWRNPLAISASMIQSYGKGKWNLYMFLIDLYSGIESLSKAYSDNKERVLAVSYESLVAEPDTEIAKVLTYLGLDDVSNLSSNLENADILWGDRTGQFKYNSVSTGSIDSWKTVMSSPYRKSWSNKYLNWIGKDRLAVMGYDLDELQAELQGCPTRYQYFLSDIVRSFYGKIYNRYCIEDIRSNKPWRDNIYFPKN